MGDTSQTKHDHDTAKEREGSHMPVVRHVGPTLESDPKYLRQTDAEPGDLTPEAQIANVGAAPDTTMSRGTTDLSADTSSTDDAAKTRVDAGPEALKTRLPGDASSDPHTDLGPPNATTVPRREG